MTEKLEEHETIVSRILQNEIVKIIFIISTIFTVVNYIIIPLRLQGQEIVNIKTNHLHTIEANMIEVKALNQKNVDENNTQHRLIMEQLVKTATVLDLHLKD